MAQNIILLGATYQNVPAVVLPKSGGGTAQFDDTTDADATANDILNGKTAYVNGVKITGTGTGGAWNYIGEDAEFVASIYTPSAVALNATLFSTWTPSTTAKTIVATQSLSAFTADFSQYEYLIRWKWAVDIHYNSGATMKAQISHECAEQWQWIGKRPSSLTNIANDNFNGNACVTYFNGALLAYYNTSGSLTYTWATSYGIYGSLTAATFGSSTADSTNVTPKTPAWTARCSSAYFATGRAGELDKANTKLYMKGELYRVKKNAYVRTVLGHTVDIYNDPTNL